ncbi:tryptophan synthase subunit alpha [Candidatus Sumerlaeota bacterium]|nr:tryptophan synthase subunit alpha [Candidatus Sumerlaeota bacterium]
MNRIDALFAQKRKEGKTALLLYVTAGFPDLKTTEALIPVLEKAGADLIEIGVPFSDPIADGPTIQKASSLSLKAGATLKKIIDTIRALRRKTQVPLLLFSSYNPVLKYDPEKLIRDASGAGVDGILLPDLPPEEADRVIALCERARISHVFLIAPTTPPDRAEKIVKESSGFIYYVSTKGVTGARDKLDRSISAHVAQLRKLTDKPICVGFGISKPEHAKSLKGKVAGIVVGSALIREIEAGKTREDRLERAAQFTRNLARALE